MGKKTDGSKFKNTVTADELLDSDEELRYVTQDNLASALIDFSVKSKDGKTSRRRPKVYFAAHPEDFKKYFGTLTDKILRLYSCDIYYLEGETPDYAPLKQRIAEMNLMVFPVTANFLAGNNRAFDCEVKAALECGVTILPVLAGGDAEEFNRKIGSYEALNINNSDFDKKLESFLKRTIPGRGEIERICAEFSARLFLSYRKKDVAQARKFIALLRKDEYFRDASVWYDDYLTVGEDYNEEIAQALQSSDTFVLLATPNLVDGDNYVVRVEYPAAVKSAKPVMAVEAVATDRGLLKMKFAGEYPLFSIDDTNGVNGFLRRRLSKKLGSVKDTPEHKYYIGLAYCTGIDTEVDVRLGAKLLSESADAGYLPALLKLIALRPYNEGLVKSEKVIKWCEDALNSMSASGKTADIAAYETLAGELVVEYIRVYRLEKAASLILRMIDFIGKNGERRPEIYEKYARLYFRLATACELRGDLMSAEKYAEIARDYLEKLFALDLADAPNELYYLIMATVTRISFNGGNAPKAVEAGKKAVARFSRTGEIMTNGEKSAYTQFAVSFIGILLRTQLYDYGLELSEDILNILSELEETEIVKDTRSQLYETLGTFYFGAADGDKEILGTALYYLQEALKIADDMSDDNPAGKYLRIAKYSFNFGAALSQGGYGDDSVKVLDNVINICKNVEFHQGQRYTLLKEATNTVANELVSQNKYSEALARYDDFVSLAEDGALGWADTAYDGANFSYRAAYICLKFTGDKKSASAYKQKALGYIARANKDDEKVNALHTAIKNLPV